LDLVLAMELDQPTGPVCSGYPTGFRLGKVLGAALAMDLELVLEPVLAPASRELVWATVCTLDCIVAVQTLNARGERCIGLHWWCSWALIVS